jgi:hypothetical protein
MPFSVLYNIYQKQGLTIPLESSYFRYSTPPNTARLRKIVGWVEALRNPTEPTKCWVTLREAAPRLRSSTQPTRVKVFGQNLRSIATPPTADFEIHSLRDRLSQKFKLCHLQSDRYS